MKKIAFILICVLVMAQLPFALTASAMEYHGFEYGITDGTVGIIRYNGDSANVVVPGIIDGMPVTHIAPYAFYRNENLESVLISHGVESIGIGVFDGCTNLTYVEIPLTVKLVGNYAFADTPWLANQTRDFVVVGDQVLLKYNGSDTHVDIPGGIKTLGSGAFEFCTAVETVNIPGSVKTIQPHTFYASGLTSIDIPEGMTVHESAFAGCNELRSVVIPQNWTEIPFGLFSGCARLETVNIPDGITTIREYAFSGCPALEKITLHRGVTDIANYAFTNTYNLTIYGYRGSYAQKYANIHEIPFVNIWNTAVRNLGVYNGNTQVYTLSEQNLRVGALVDSCDMKNPVLIGALYRSGILVDTKTASITPGVEDAMYYTEAFDRASMQGDLADYEIRAFVWEKSTLEPLASNTVVSASTVEPYHFTEQEFRDRLDGSTVTIPLTTAFAEDLLALGYVDFITHNKTAAAITNLINGDKDIIFTTYPADEDFIAAAAAGVELECVPVVNDAFVFLANVDNPVEGLSQEQIRDIYSGQITSWIDMFGIAFFRDLAVGSFINEETGEEYFVFHPEHNFDRIMAFQRNETSGSQTGMIDFMGDVPISIVEDDRAMAWGMGRLVDGIGEYVNAIGYSYYYFAENQNEYYEYRDRVKYLALDGVMPTNETIRSGEYPVITPYYAIIRKDAPEGGFARELLKYVLSEKGQYVAETAGYVGVGVQ